MAVRTERESDRKRSGRLVGAAETSEELAEWRRLQQRNLNILGLVKRKESPKESSWQVRQSRSCQKKKEQGRLSRVPDRKRERVKASESRTLAREKGRSEREHGEERVESTVKEDKFQGGKEGKARRTSIGIVERSKSSPGGSAESWFHSKSGQT